MTKRKVKNRKGKYGPCSMCGAADAFDFWLECICPIEGRDKHKPICGTCKVDVGKKIIDGVVDKLVTKAIVNENPQFQ